MERQVATHNLQVRDQRVDNIRVRDLDATRLDAEAMREGARLKRVQN